MRSMSGPLVGWPNCGVSRLGSSAALARARFVTSVHVAAAAGLTGGGGLRLSGSELASSAALARARSLASVHVTAAAGSTRGGGLRGSGCSCGGVITTAFGSVVDRGRRPAGMEPSARGGAEGVTRPPRPPKPALCTCAADAVADPAVAGMAVGEDGAVTGGGGAAPGGAGLVPPAAATSEDGAGGVEADGVGSPGAGDVGDESGEGGGGD